MRDSLVVSLGTDGEPDANFYQAETEALSLGCFTGSDYARQQMIWLYPD